ncbi:MAG: DUF4388 domain-containing protein [Candidatus Omnitrophota bacterium]
MAFKGTLKEFKIPDILQIISYQKKTGLLTFIDNKGGVITLIFEDGMIVGVDSYPKKLEMQVGNVLVKQDFISEEMLQRALDIQKRTNQRVGEILLSMGLVSRETLQESLKTQAIQIIFSLFTWKAGEYNFKVMESLDEEMKMISPINTDNLIMEGVQMLDEWPQIKKLIHDEFMIFEQTAVDSQNIEIVSEYDDIPEGETEKIYLTETEINLLKYINGLNTVQDLVDMGIFTEYKVYKALSNLIQKFIIQAKPRTTGREVKIPAAVQESMRQSAHHIGILLKALLAFLLAIFLLSLFRPLNPFQSENILIRKDLYETVFRLQHPTK